MGQYSANSTNSRNFILTFDNEKLGELIYQKWYSFAAEILMSNGKEYTLEPKGFWDSTVELKEGEVTLLKFKMGWKGIIIKTYFDNEEKHFLLKLKGLLGNKFVLLNNENEELMAAETDFKWSKLNFDYTIETSPKFDNFSNEKLLLLTVLHCINYYITVIVAAA
ncbi:hypothetical protein [Spirosoma linguale]|uniref:Uncharacterized protein n=1 Tax=Spirosoma linguale (strain ATCC 33905 / DSM 74 / LMG 10896 / Claus 1) TaxID=504472 RepID=D2QBE2_SPILD|nr:hypothetical protein Slin_0050 [Spirosoma linguale DSM 74]